jgi:hypothetical protein
MLIHLIHSSEQHDDGRSDKLIVNKLHFLYITYNIIYKSLSYNTSYYI